MEEVADEKRYLFTKKHTKYFLGFFLVLVLLSPALFYFYYQGAVERTNYPEEKIASNEDLTLPVDVIIKPGDTTTQISDLLYQNDLINSASLFKLYLFINKGKTIQAGHYRVPLNLNLPELVDFFGKGTFDIKATFLEGWRVEQYAEYISEAFNNPSLGSEFLKIAQPYEGFLFPDTYFIPREATPELILNLLRDNFTSRVDPLLPRNVFVAPGYGLNEAVILASILEREVASSEDRPIVAGILFKRLKNDWPLDADATVQYVIGQEGNWWPSNLTLDDINSYSSYNTRQVEGLPPGPICNPSLDAIKAALAPQETAYWFYLNGKDGLIHFAKTIEEHNANIATYL
ncbi:endolytic transglycosylase MltG [Patescibacteria group bacterium]|nr:endolytic transglycosylase MltG [Patescibacteria group bacterium]